MKNIEQYRKRFNSLLESTMGDVRPLISEAPQFEEFVVPTMDMLKKSFAFATTKDLSSYFKKLNVKTSLNGNEYKMTLPEGVYSPDEMINVEFNIDKTLMIYPPNENNELSLDKIDKVLQRNLGDVYGIYFNFYLPETQEKFLEEQPYYGYLDVQCKNVKGGKIRFSVEVPSGSEIYEGFETSGNTVTTGTTGSTLTLVAGPIGKGYLKRYIYKENDRFYIYYSTFKNPEHKLDTELEDKGRGYQTTEEAMNVILQNTPN